MARRSCPAHHVIQRGGPVMLDALPGVAPRSRRRVPLTEELRQRLVWLGTDDSVAAGDERRYAGHAVFPGFRPIGIDSRSVSPLIEDAGCFVRGKPH